MQNEEMQDKKLAITFPDVPTFDRLGIEICEQVRLLLSRKRKSHDQRTPGWGDERFNCATASGIAAILLLSQMEIDLRDSGQLDLEPDKKVGQVMPAFNSYAKEMRIKCGVEASEGGNIYTEWGVTYEPVVKALYEQFHNVVVHEFGLVKHEKHEWLGASPDGITSQGRMIEIKCPYSRQPKGMPKCQYYVQMQIQMACCGFDECDFLDIVVKEYACKADYLNDTYGTGTADANFVYHRNANGMPKGLVIEWEHTDDAGKTTRNYYYPPVLAFQNQAEEEAWIESWAQAHFAEHPLSPLDLIYRNRDNYRFRYWWIEEWHATLVARNQRWLDQRLPEIHEFWKLVLKYRKEGLPDKFRGRSSTTVPDAVPNKIRFSAPEGVCLFEDDGEV